MRIYRVVVLMVVLALFVGACGNTDEATDTTVLNQTTQGEDAATDTTAPDSDTTTTAPETTTTQPAEMMSVTIGTPAEGWFASPFYFGIEQGIFEKHGLDVEMLLGQSPTIIAAVIAGELQYVASMASALQANLVGEATNLKNFLVTTGPPLFDLVAGPEFESPEDLVGQAVGVNAVGGGSHDVLVQHLENAGLEADSVVATGLGAPPNLLEAVETGSVAAAVISPPLNLEAARRGLNILAEGTSLPAEAIGGLTTTPEYFEAHQEEAKALTRALLESIDTMINNPEETQEWMMEFYALPDEEMTTEYYEQVLVCLVPEGRIDPELVQAQLERVARINDVEPPPPGYAEDAIDYSLLEEVQSEEG